MSLKKPEDRQFWMGMYHMATVGINIVVATFMGLAMGWYLDHKILPKLIGIDTTPWCTLIFLLFGIIAGFRNVFKMAMRKDDTPDNATSKDYDSRGDKD